MGRGIVEFVSNIVPTKHIIHSRILGISRIVTFRLQDMNEIFVKFQCKDRGVERVHTNQCRMTEQVDPLVWTTILVEDTISIVNITASAVNGDNIIYSCLCLYIIHHSGIVIKPIPNKIAEYIFLWQLEFYIQKL